MKIITIPIQLEAHLNVSEIVFNQIGIEGIKRVLESEGFILPEEALILYDAARSQKPNSIIVEIGAYKGKSTLHLALGAMHNNSKLYSIDPWVDYKDERGKLVKMSRREWERNTDIFRQYITAIQGKSQEVADKVPSGINVLFVDGSHKWDDVVEDIRLYFPKLADGAIVIFHDYTWMEDVQKAVNLFVKPYCCNFGYLHMLFWAKFLKGRWEGKNVSRSY